MKVWKSTMYQAIKDAIIQQEKIERGSGFTGDSSYLAQLRIILKAIDEGQSLYMHED